MKQKVVVPTAQLETFFKYHIFIFGFKIILLTLLGTNSRIPSTLKNNHLLSWDVNTTSSNLIQFLIVKHYYYAKLDPKVENFI